MMKINLDTSNPMKQIKNGYLYSLVRFILNIKLNRNNFFFIGMGAWAVCFYQHIVVSFHTNPTFNLNYLFYELEISGKVV